MVLYTFTISNPNFIYKEKKIVNSARCSLLAAHKIAFLRSQVFKNILLTHGHWDTQNNIHP